MTPPLRRVDVDGHSLAYVELGEGDPLVLLHGYPQSHAMWRHHLEPLARHRRVIAPDWFGWGESERKPDVDLSYAREIERVGLLLDAFEVERCDLVLHDYGVLIGLGYLAVAPSRARRVALINSRSHQTFPGAMGALINLCASVARAPIGAALLHHAPLAGLHRRILREHVQRGCFDEELMGQYIGWMGTAEGRRWFARFYAGYEYPAKPELLTVVRDLRIPIAVIWGDEDAWCPPSVAQELAAANPDATLTTLKGASHYVVEERPAEVLAALEAWLARPAS